MRKLAIFVEGQTELIFVDRLVRELAEGAGLAIEHAEATGGASGARRVKTFKHPAMDRDYRLYVLIVNCCGDGNVKSDVRDRYYGLVQAGYHGIFGLRDVFGAFTLKDVPKLRHFLDFGIPPEPIRVQFFLAIMEIEAWFLGEYHHFLRLDSRLTPQFIRKTCGFDPARDELQDRFHPADDLRRIYKLAGYSYDKHRKTIQRTVDFLDYNFIRCCVSARFSDLRNLLEGLANALQVNPKR